MVGEAIAALHQHWPWFWPLWAGVLGGVLGSFLSCVWYRLPRGLSLRQPPSACPSCQTQLGVIDLVPVLSWLWLKGRCRHCRAVIPWRTLVLEVACVAGAAGLAWWVLRP